MNKINKKYITYTLLVVWCGVIFYLSSQPANVSGPNSLSVLDHILFWINPTYLIGFNETFREFMHSFVYFVLGMLAFVSFRYHYVNAFVVSLFFCMLYSLSDEIHQLFVPGRAFQVFDMGLDFIGSLVGICIIKLERMLHND